MALVQLNTHPIPKQPIFVAYSTVRAGMWKAPALPGYRDLLSGVDGAGPSE
jgi:hypothetical protein